MTLSSFQIVAELVLKLVTITTIVTGALWAVYEYREANRKEDVARTLSFRDIFENRDFLGAENSVKSAWSSHTAERRYIADELSNALRNGDRQRVKQAVANWNLFVVNVVRRLGKAENDLQLLIDRLNYLAVCVNSGLCDVETAQRFYGEYARKLVDLHCPYILFVRSNGATRYAYDLEKFSGNWVPGKIRVVVGFG